MEKPENTGDISTGDNRYHTFRLGSPRDVHNQRLNLCVFPGERKLAEDINSTKPVQRFWAKVNLHIYNILHPNRIHVMRALINQGGTTERIVPVKNLENKDIIELGNLRGIALGTTLLLGTGSLIAFGRTVFEVAKPVTNETTFAAALTIFAGVLIGAITSTNIYYSLSEKDSIILEEISN